MSDKEMSPEELAKEDVAMELVNRLMKTVAEFVHEGNFLSDRDMGAAMATFMAYILNPIPPDGIPEWCLVLQKIHLKMRHDSTLGRVNPRIARRTH